MKINDLLRLIKKHLVLLVLTPVVLAVLVAYLTRNPQFIYTSETTLYTGIASGGGIEMNKNLSFFATNTAFDNLINVIKSRQTQQEVGIRLLALHLMLDKPDPQYLNKASFQRLRQLTHKGIYNLVVRDIQNGKQIVASPPPIIIQQGDTRSQKTSGKVTHTVRPGETLFGIARKYRISMEELKGMNDISGDEVEQGQVLRVSPYGSDTESEEQSDEDPSSRGQDNLIVTDTFSFSNFDTSDLQQTLPSHINRAAFEQTVSNLTNYCIQNDTNFVYKLLNFSNPHYSIKAISSVNVTRIASSDLVKIKYENDDPGICQNTLAILIEVCIKNYKLIKENRSDAVVKYFEYQVRLALARLTVAEDKLLKFNKDNNIINYYEQSKAVAVVKEDLDVLYNNKRMLLAGAEAAIERIEQKLGNLKKIQLNSQQLLDLRNQLMEANMKIAASEIFHGSDSAAQVPVPKLQADADKIKKEIRNTLTNLYSFSHSTDGLPISSLLNDWMANVLVYEETKAGLSVLADRIQEFRKQYDIYAPAGANLKRIEREINVSEQAYLELLHGLNLAKLKMQDIELSSNIKAVDPPYFPLSPNPTKRSLLVVVAGLLGFLGVLITILAMEYLDNTLKNPERASKILQLACGGIFPKIYLKQGSLNFPFITNRLIEMMIQKIANYPESHNNAPASKSLLFFSTRSHEGKTILMGNLANKLKKQGYKVLVLSFSRESLRKAEMAQIGYTESARRSSRSGIVRNLDKFFLLKRLLGYPDTRIDKDSPFLESPENYLEPEEYLIYQCDESFHTIKDYQDLLRKNHFRLSYIPDFILLEIPPILYYSYPATLVESCDISLMVCRANRTWSVADQGSLEMINKASHHPPLFLLNGVEIPVIESVLGELPKRRNFLLRAIKKLVSFQFYEKHRV